MKRFHIQITDEDDRGLKKLSKILTERMGVRITRISATQLAIRAMLKKEKV